MAVRFLAMLVVVVGVALESCSRMADAYPVIPKRRWIVKGEGGGGGDVGNVGNVIHSRRQNALEGRFVCKFDLRDFCGYPSSSV